MRPTGQARIKVFGRVSVTQVGSHPCPRIEARRQEKILGVRKACGSLCIKHASGFITAPRLQVGKSRNRPKPGDPRIVVNDLNDHVGYLAQASLMPTDAEELGPVDGERVALSGVVADLQRLVGQRLRLGRCPRRGARTNSD